MLDTCNDLTLAHMHRLVREGRRFCRRRAWRRAAVLRSTRFAVTIAALQRALGHHYLRRAKEAESRQWRVYASSVGGDEVLAAIVSGGPTRTLEEMRARLRVELCEPALFDLARLQLALGAEVER